ncbi:killer cell lectin-like receptor 5 [Phyllostomus hastatus]|uniref:killer cell lectin-like receptor 5 n=1 Tax=Phyllostomus hastatus TaxID=9423 RepID=UPI001E67FCAC|nr:killer cell lectin-like receptor 5 [Phyllostomus hastatus]
MYSEVKNTTSNSNQTKITRNKYSKRKGSSVLFPWCLTVVILGIFCFFLLVTTGILGLMVFQGHHKCQPQKPPLEDNSMLKNIPVVVEPFNTGNNSTCERKWSCCGEKCYYFSHELKSFEESRRSCNKMNSALLKIDDEKELKFLESQLSSFHWIGLSRKGVKTSWTWEDNSPHFLKINWQEPKSGNCARMTARKMVASECSKSSYYVCEKVKCISCYQITRTKTNNQRH